MSERPEFWKTGNFKKDVAEINDYVAKHSDEFLGEDVIFKDSVVCRSKLIKSVDPLTGVLVYGYALYKNNVMVGFKHLDIYEP